MRVCAKDTGIKEGSIDDVHLHNVLGDRNILEMDTVIPGMKACWIADPEGNIVELNQGYKDQDGPPPFEV